MRALGKVAAGRRANVIVTKGTPARPASSCKEPRLDVSRTALIRACAITANVFVIPGLRGATAPKTSAQTIVPIEVLAQKLAANATLGTSGKTAALAYVPMTAANTAFATTESARASTTTMVRTAQLAAVPMNALGVEHALKGRSVTAWLASPARIARWQCAETLRASMANVLIVCVFATPGTAGRLATPKCVLTIAVAMGNVWMVHANVTMGTLATTAAPSIVP